jgi:endonuclease YncB( thermonuclease family)
MPASPKASTCYGTLPEAISVSLRDVSQGRALSRDSAHRGQRLFGQVHSALQVLAAVAVLLSAPAPVAHAAQISGRVVGISDGDTLTLLTTDRKRVRIRLAEIDAPEKGQPFAQRSRQRLSQLVFSKTVTVTTRGKDQYGRILGKVFVGGTNVNAEMVRSGAAWAYRDYLTDYSLVSREAEARKSRSGLWAQDGGQTVPPWEWRNGQRQRSSEESTPTPVGGRCGGKRYCRQMASCEEAHFYLEQCGVSSLDGDRDGRPCEVLCRGR